MLDVNWLTPAKRRQLVVVGEEGMFELDYLTQRLTFTRANDTTNPRLIGGLRPDVRGRGRRAAGRQRRAARRRARRVPRRRPRRRPAGRRRRGRPLGGRDRHALLEAAAAGQPVELSELFARRCRMTIVSRPSVGAVAARRLDRDCRPTPAATSRPGRCSPWVGEPGTGGRVAVVGAGQDGPPARRPVREPRLAGHGRRRPAGGRRTRSTRVARTSPRSRGWREAVRAAREGGRLRATTDAAAAARERDVVVIIVPVMLDDEQQPDYRYMDAAVASIAPGVHEGSLVIFETTLPVGDTRDRFTPRLARRSRPRAPTRTSSSPSRPSGCTAAPCSATSRRTRSSSAGSARPRPPVRRPSTTSVLDAEIVAMSSAEAAEFSKLADTTYRDVNIALANEFARYAERVGVDIQEVIAAANSQPYSHIHQPGLGVGGHCIPVYPHFLLSPGAGAGAGRALAPGQRRPGGDRDPRDPARARRPRRRARISDT